MMALAGLRALLLQALHPQASIGVGQNSDFQSDAWGRLRRTAEYLGLITFGTTTEALTCAARVRAIHSALSAVDPRTGFSFRLDEPEPLLWVHCCLVDSILEVLARSGTRISPEDADAYVLEQVRSATLVGLDPEIVPRTEAELAEYFRRMRPHLLVTDLARQEASFVIAPPLPLYLAPVARPAWSAVAGLAFAALPRWARRLYSMPELPGAAALHGSATTVGLYALRASLRGVQVAVPPLREGPHLRAARARLAVVPP